MNQKSKRVTFCNWIGNRDVITLGTNTGAQALPFQDWCKFKEAFAPELVARALNESPVSVNRCIDPFGGSGTTGLACQFLGAHPILAEVNPYLADLIESKLTFYPSPEELDCDLNTILDASNCSDLGNALARFSAAPRTFIEPGHDGRWIFNRGVAERIAVLLDAIEELGELSSRLFRILLGGILIEVSNVRISGKGRRYRRNWEARSVHPERVVELFSAAARRAIEDIRRFTSRPTTSYEVIRGDSRALVHDVDLCELAVFSPPYPNSSDYTDIYNVELWTLGYLDNQKANSAIRLATLSSHVQISRNFPKPPEGSITLDEVIGSLESSRNELWDQRIPAMVGAYFSELMQVLDHLARVLVSGGSAWLVVGDSRYAGVQIPVANVLKELVTKRGWTVLNAEPFRSMRTSAQQGGERKLSEQLLVIRNSP